MYHMDVLDRGMVSGISGTVQFHCIMQKENLQLKIL